jgi:hypothetical protein
MRLFAMANLARLAFSDSLDGERKARSPLVGAFPLVVTTEVARLGKFGPEAEDQHSHRQSMSQEGLRSLNRGSRAS